MEMEIGHAAALGQVRRLQAQGLRLGHEPSPVGSSMLPQPVPRGSAQHIQALAYRTHPAQQTAARHSPKQATKEFFCQHRRLPSRCSQKHWAGWGDTSHTSQCSSSPPARMGQRLRCSPASQPTGPLTIQPRTSGAGHLPHHQPPSARTRRLGGCPEVSLANPLLPEVLATPSEAGCCPSTPAACREQIHRRGRPSQPGLCPLLGVEGRTG